MENIEENMKQTKNEEDNGISISIDKKTAVITI